MDHRGEMDWSASLGEWTIGAGWSGAHHYGGQKSKLKECLSMKFGNTDIFMDSLHLEKN